MIFKLLLASVPMLMPVPELPEIHTILGGNWVNAQCTTDTECDEWEAREEILNMRKEMQ